MHLLLAGAYQTVAERHIWVIVLPEQGSAGVAPTGRSGVPGNHPQTPESSGPSQPGVQADAPGPPRKRTNKRDQSWSLVQGSGKKDLDCSAHHNSHSAVRAERLATHTG